MSQDFEIMLYHPKCDNVGHLYVQVWLLTLTRGQKFYFKVAKAPKKGSYFVTFCGIMWDSIMWGFQNP